MENLEQIKKNMEQRESLFSEFACKSSFAIRLNEESSDIRGSFQRDVDKIIHTLSYTRYADKTQVYSDIRNDNTSTRMTHVQFVSRASRTIARALNLNEDLCEAISLGHDIGHVPYGHDGERILSKICMERMGMPFAHNIQSVRTFLEIEKKGKGLNLTLQVLDGIMCHNGEMLEKEYYPKTKNYLEFKKEYEECLRDNEKIKSIRPMTLEGCIVRISDIIGYIGKDIDDAIRLNMLSKDDIPENIKEVLGENNDQIMNSIILDIINESYNKPYIKMSDRVSKAVTDLKDFNYKNIYYKASTKEFLEECEKKFFFLFDTYLNALNKKDTNNDIYQVFLEGMSDKYIQNNSNERKVIDFIAGMTDNYFESQYEKYSND